MKRDFSLDEARRLLRGHFGAHWVASYEEGKTEMAWYLADWLGFSPQHAVETIERLEQRGALEFTSGGCRTPRMPTLIGALPTGPADLSPCACLSPALDLGAWNISTARDGVVAAAG